MPTHALKGGKNFSKRRHNNTKFQDTVTNTITGVVIIKKKFTSIWLRDIFSVLWYEL
jgi:hypothetical protein